VGKGQGLAKGECSGIAERRVGREDLGQGQEIGKRRGLRTGIGKGQGKG
jgi:hypothetical protein